MNEQLWDYYAKRGFSAEQADEAVCAVRVLESWLVPRTKSLDDVGVSQIRDYIRLLIEQNRNSPESLLAHARYFYLSGRNEIYVYFTSLPGGAGVIESISERLGLLEIAGNGARADRRRAQAAARF
ncbi:MAG: hypothetical protein R2912_08175 [Eubacteriales bacterium]